jgi:hypothetical protein
MAFRLWLGALLLRYGQQLAPVRQWEAGVSAPQDGRVIVGAWSTLHNAERAWRFRLIRWDAPAAHWTICDAVIGTARKSPTFGGPRDIGVWPLAMRQRPEFVPPPEVWREVWDRQP